MVYFKDGATKTAIFLKDKQYVISKIGNSQSYHYNDTLIVDWKGNLEKSLKLSKLLNIDPENIVVYDRQEKPLDVTLVLGRDWTEHYIATLDDEKRKRLSHCLWKIYAKKHDLDENDLKNELRFHDSVRKH